MIYFDTDVWINSFVTQNKTKHEESNLWVWIDGCHEVL